MKPQQGFAGLRIRAHLVRATLDSTMTEPRLILGSHLRATPDGRVVVRASGSGLATVTLRSARTITTRWLGRGRPRVVRFGMQRVGLRPGETTEITFKLSKDHLAMLHRMQTVRATVRLQTDAGVVTRRIDLHSPASPRRRRRTRGQAERAASQTSRSRGRAPVRSSAPE